VAPPIDTPHPGRRAILKLAAISLLAPALINSPTATAAVAPSPVPATVRRLKLSSGLLREIDPSEHVRQLPPEVRLGRHARSYRVFANDQVEAGRFVLAAVTWTASSAASSMRLLVRARVRSGWLPWQDLHEDDHRPDGDSTEAASARAGSTPLIVPDADAVGIRIETRGGLPADLELVLVDTATSTPDTLAASSAELMTTTAATRPTILTRAEWGADESIREPGEPDYGQVLGGFVHHTAGTNSYYESDVPSIIRSIYVYHVTVRDWRDIGYNFLVDRFGRIWEGRYGGVDRAVIGAHTAGYNAYAFAMAAIGTYTSQIPESALLTAYHQLFAWKFSLHGVNPSVTVSYPGGQALLPISGHRDADSTECPGTQLYSALPAIRSGVAALMSDFPRAASALRLEGPASGYVGSTAQLNIYWSAGGWVSGIVNLQVWNDGAWRYVRQIQVTNGRASVPITVDRTRTYRVAARYAPGVQLGYSQNVTVNALPRPAAVRLSAPSTAELGSTVRIDVYWTSGVGLTGRVNLQRKSGSSWVYDQQVEVRAGRGATTITLISTSTYRAYAQPLPGIQSSISREITITAV
jgi:hypothetical protein